MSGGTLSKITVVTAPPGFGKTVLLSQAYRRLSRSGCGVRWLGLDERDCGFGNLLTLTGIMVGLQEPLFRKTEQFLCDNRDRIEAILNALEKVPEPLILFIDNIDFCKEAGVDDLLNALVFETPDWIRIVISSSNAIVPFNVGQARLDGKLKALTASDLSFDRRDAAALFSLAGLRDIDEGLLDTVISKTEGWAAAVRLLQLSNDTEEALKRGVALFSGKDEHISDILSRRLISTLDAELVRFLYEISEFSVFSAELALVATGDSSAPDWLNLIVQRNMLIIPVDNQLVWFRFHTLFRDFLRKEAACKLPRQRRHEVHLSAAHWLMKRGDYQMALELTINVRELDLTSQLLDEVARVLVRDQGDTSAFIRWVEKANEIGAKRNIQTMSWYVWALLFERRFEQAREEARSITRLLDEAPEGAFSPALRAKVGFVEGVAAVHLDATENALAIVDSWLPEFPDAEPFEIAAMAGVKACSLLVNHDFAAARSILRFARSTISQSSSIYGVCWVEALSALVDLAQGHPAAVESILGDLGSQLDARSQLPAGIASVIGVVRARSLYDCGRFQEAKHLVEKKLQRAASVGIPDTTWLGLEVALPFSLAANSSLGMDDLLAIVKKYPKRLSLLFEMRTIQFLLLQDCPEGAFDHAEELGWNSKLGWHSSLLEGTSDMERFAARYTAAALLSAGGRLSAASEIIHDEIRRVKKTGRCKAQIDLNLLNSEVHFRAGTREAALRSLARAISISAKRKIYSPFIERRSFLLQLRENLRSKDLGLTNREEIAALSEIHRFIGLAPAETPFSPAKSQIEYLTDPLTPREVELLSLLEAGLDNAGIAERLDVTVRTVKWHLSNLYAKLDVKNRSAAMAKARTLRIA